MGMLQIGVIGMNHKTASIHLREQLSRECQRLFEPASFFLSDICVVPLLTCNRVEIYFSSSNLAETHTLLLDLLRKALGSFFEPFFYSFFGKDAFLHLASVSSGLDSAFMGESEIQGQVRRAYKEACNFSFLSKDLHFVFQKTLKIGKDIRTRFSNPSSMALGNIVAQEIEDFLPSTLNRKLLFVGFSRMNLSLFPGLVPVVQSIDFCNRNQQKMKTFLEEKKCGAFTFSELATRWTDYDCVLFGTHAGKYLAMTQHLIQAKMKPRLLIDLSMPRNVDPKLAHFHQTRVLNIDQLHQKAEKESLENESISIRNQYVGDKVQRYVELFKTKNLSFGFSSSDSKGTQIFSKEEHSLKLSEN